MPEPASVPHQDTVNVAVDCTGANKATLLNSYQHLHGVLVEGFPRDPQGPPSDAPEGRHDLIRQRGEGLRAGGSR